MDILLAYWSHEELVANGLIVLHLLGALAVGLIIGYERSYHGRAAGMRTYALVCVGSTVLTVISGFPGHWFGGMNEHVGVADPTRVIQGIMTGIGFLGAGVIMKEGFTIRGLSTSASIWITSAIGITIGVGFYGAAMATALICILVMSGLRQVEHMLPHQSVVHLTVSYPRHDAPTLAQLRERMASHNFEIIDWSFMLIEEGRHFEYQLVLQTPGHADVQSLLAEIANSEGVLAFRLSPSRN